MSEDQARKFIEKLQTDKALRKRLNAVIEDEGFMCTLEEIRAVEWELMVARNFVKLPASEHWDF